MESTSNNDYFLKFSPIYREGEEITEYILIECNQNLYNAIQEKPDNIIGKNISQIIYEYNNLLGLQYYYFFNIPMGGARYEYFNEEFNRWYFISILKDAQSNLIVFYTDISFKEEEIRKLKQDISNQNLKIYYHRDKLTNLYTKDFFEEELRRLDTKRQLPLSIIMGDLNGLKLINDAFGHRMGDRAIRMVANILKENFRKEDILSRIGGDEFLILLPNTSNKTALSIIENLKNAFSNKTLDFLPLSVSFGLATKQSPEEDIEIAIKRAEDKMYFLKLKESKDAKLFTIQYLKEKLRKISFETKGHQQRLQQVSCLMAAELNLSEIEKEELRLLCEYHDIGKIGVPHHILLKEGTLNKEEWIQMRRHSEIGYHIIRSAKETLAVDELILVHHERWDGKGYPRKLKGQEIPLTVRIFLIADAYVAMVEGRPYKDRISHNEAVEEIRKGEGTQFDPNLVELFLGIKENILKTYI